jgi:hypothetical protein
MDEIRADIMALRVILYRLGMIFELFPIIVQSLCHFAV